MVGPDPTRALYLIKLVETLAALGRDPGQLLRAGKIPPAMLADNDASLPLARYVDIVELATSHYDIPDLGFCVGEQTQMTEHGVLGYALLSASSLGESLRRYERYQYLQGPLLAIELGNDEKFAWLTARPIAAHPALAASVLTYTIQEWLVGWNQWSPIIRKRGAFFDRVELALDEPPDKRLYERHLGCAATFCGDVTRAFFPRESLEHPLDYDDAGAAAMCDEQCEHILRHLNLGHGLVAEVHRQLASIPGRVPTLDQLSKHFFVDARTMRRRLLREGTTYRDVVADFRIALARRYLAETRLPANEIATLVGYADSANLYRTFRTAFDMTPRQFRERLAG
jgi:AraC-like DNA-binding protein